MAATRLIALHVNKGKTVAQCLADRTDYSQNAAKTNDGEFISSYECDPKTADEEFLLSKRQYQHITGRQQKNNIIAYQIRQSFKPGEITPEEANQVGYETAMRWTKGKHAFIVATHIDKSHIHNHIIYNSTSLDATRKFKNFFLSGLAVQRLSDMVCLEHGLSIITPKPYRERQKRTVYPKKRTQRDELCDAIDAVLKQKPKSFDGFVQALADMGFEFKDGKQPAFKGENQKRFIRLRSLGEGYSKEEIQAVISGKNLHKSKGGSAKAPAPKQFQMLIDIQAKMAEGKTVGYAGTELSEALIRSIMKNSGADPDSVKLVDVGFDLMSSMTTGNVDATIGCLVNHEVPQLEKEGFEVNYFFPDDYGVPKYYEGIFLASDDMIANNSDTLKGFLRACSKGFEDFKNNTDDVLQVLLDNQDEANFALDPDVEKKSCETLLPLMETEDAKFLSQTEQCWQENIDWMYDQGLIAEKPDVSDVMVNLDF